ncbi:energy-coupling factor transport system permease protein [Gracilibacillus halotolerans]|uniref:Energy-coupling factor transporter transmembrane protein EcfT n=1 Tax=Gracilibacillus halotolerans TaxID=74386 RepID=A0A841RMT1_9BACI|nr:energy-coupling factor transporter transmembrane component T [Gracilibacillus halotolerans]MBB6512933.1 energy-coupling factor transport system permease protein [Gracilibacillus halotolerans]
MKSWLVIGQYLPGNSFIHRLDPRTKLIIIFSFVCVLFFANHWTGYLLFTTFTIVSIVLSKVSVPFLLKGITPVWFFIVLTFFLHILITKEGEILWELGWFQVYEAGLQRSIEISWRLLILVVFTSLLTLTTAPMEITDALESLLGPLKRWNLPIHELALMMSISLRFIPTLMDETERISKAQASRGVDLKSGTLKDRMYAFIPLLIPLFIGAFKRAEDLATAMEVRGYQGGEGRTKLRALQFSNLDIIAAIGYVIVLILFIYIRQ